MSIDNTKWHARVGMFYILNVLGKSKSKTKRKSPFLIHLRYLPLLYLFDVPTFQLNNVRYVFNYLLSKSFTSYLHKITKLLKIANIIIFLFLCISNLLSHCFDIETNSGPK